MTTSEILLMKKAGDLFSNDLNKCKLEYKELAKRWHPDMNKDDTNNVFMKISELYNQALQLIESGQWEKSNYIQIKTTTNKNVAINFLDTYDFELGTCFVCEKFIIYQFFKDKKKYYDNAVNTISNLKYSNSNMEKEMSRFLPKIINQFVSTDGDYYMVIQKTPDVYPLKNLLNYFHGEIPDKHVAWMVSRLSNIACYLEHTGQVHNGLLDQNNVVYMLI